MISEKIELLGKDVYANIPSELTLKSFPTATELDYVGHEDFEKTMLEVIFPQCIEEKINFYDLLEIDFQWICRGLRFLNYGPYHTTNALICSNCGTLEREYQVDLRAVECKLLPQGFKNDIVLKKEEFVDYQKDVHLHMLTIQEALNLRKDKLFANSKGKINTDYARICYSISSMGSEKDITAVTAKIEIEKNMSPADFRILQFKVKELTDYGLRGGGRCTCPQCNEKDAAVFLALADDRFFRPSVGDLKKGRDDRNLRGIKKPTGDKTEAV